MSISSPIYASNILPPVPIFCIIIQESTSIFVLLDLQSHYRSPYIFKLLLLRKDLNGRSDVQKSMHVMQVYVHKTSLIYHCHYSSWQMNPICIYWLSVTSLMLTPLSNQACRTKLSVIERSNIWTLYSFSTLLTSRQDYALSLFHGKSKKKMH